MNNKFISLALCLCMALTLLPATALAAGTAATSVWVNGAELTSSTPYIAQNETVAQETQPSDGYAYFCDGTLTLSGYQNSTSMAEQGTLGVYTDNVIDSSGSGSACDLWAAIYANGDLTLKLIGESTVNTKDGNYNSEDLPRSELARETACVYVTGALTVSGSGSAALNTGNSYHPGTGMGGTPADCPCNYGIYAGSLTVNDGTLTLDPATTSYDSTLRYNVTHPKSVMNTNVDGGMAFAYGIYSAGRIDINGGSVTAKSVARFGNNNTTHAYGIYAVGTLSVAAEAAVTADNYTRTTSPLAESWGIYSGGDMTLSGTVTAAAARGEGRTTGIESAAGLTIDGGAVVSATAKGRDIDTALMAYGVNGNSVTISGNAQVTASAYASNESYGIRAGDTVTLTDAAVITAKADGVEGVIFKAVNAGSKLDVPAGATYTNKDSVGSTETQILATEKTQPVVINCDSSVRIIFDACNGSATENIVISELTDLPVPTLTGYTFAGWYPAPNGETAGGVAFTDDNKLSVGKAKALAASATYYAKWTVGEDGKTVRTTSLSFDSSTADIDKSSTQGWTWDSSKKKLTLSGANIVTAGQYALILKTLVPVTIVLDADSVNVLSVAGGNVANSAGLYSEPSVTLSGAGTLKATGGKASTSVGIIAHLTVKDATVTAIGNSYGIKGNLTLTGGDVTANGGVYGLNCEGSTIGGGTLSATGATAGIISSGDNSITIASGAFVTATSTGVAAGSCGLQTSSTLTVDGTLVAIGGTGAHSYGADISGNLSGTGSISATGGTATGSSTGIRLLGGSTFSGTLNATGGAGSDSYGILGANAISTVTLPNDITASCDATVNRHFSVWVAGTLTGLDGKTFPGSIASSEGMSVYADDTILAQNDYFDPQNNTEFSALTIKAGKTLTIVPTANLYVASATGITIEPAGKIVNNGWIVLNDDAEGTGEKIEALGITGDGYIQAGRTVYSNAGVKSNSVIDNDLDLSAGNPSSEPGKYTYENNVLTIEKGVVLLGGVKLPAGRNSTVVLKNGAIVRDDLRIVGHGEGRLNITVATGDSASINVIDIQQSVTPPANPEDFLLTISGGGTLASSSISLSFADNYNADGSYNMSVILERNTTLNITSGLNQMGAGITINSHENIGGLTVRGTLTAHTPNTPVSLFLPRITLEHGASLSAGCEVAAELMASSGRALTMESGSTFIANGTKASIVIVVHSGQSIDSLVSLPSGTLPSGVSFRPFSSDYGNQSNTLYTLARQSDVLMDESDNAAYIPTDGQASVALRSPSSGGTGTYNTLTFDVNGGSAIDSVSKSAGITVDLSAYTPTREGFTFAGWYTDEALTEKVTSVQLNRSITVYAKWRSGAVPFTDVPENAYYTDAIIWAVGKGIADGTGATTFSPNGICTRAQAVTFLWRANGSPAPKTTAMPFSDVPTGSYYYDAVLWAVEHGIINGSAEALFSPDMSCSRAHIVTMLWRMEGSKSVEIANPFVDVSDTAYYADSVLWAVEQGITEGTSANTFGPDDNCTRAQMITFIYRDIE